MSQDELPPALRELQDQLHEAAQRDIEVERRVAQRLRRGRFRRWLLVAVAAIVSAGGVAVAQRVLDREGADEPRETIPEKVAPAADLGVIPSSATPDPSGGPPWAMRAFTNRDDLECIALGRLREGVLGTYDRRTFRRKRPSALPGACGSLRRVGLVVAAHLRGGPEPRTIVYGLVRAARPVRVTVGGKIRTLQPDSSGSFIDVRIGLFDMDTARVSTRIDGRTVSRSFG